MVVEDRIGDSGTIGRRLREIRLARRKSLRVVAGLAGISAAHLSRLENGQRALDRRSLIVALAWALEVAPSELMSLPVPALGESGRAGTVDALRVRLLAAGVGRPGGQVQPVEVLSVRVTTLLDAQQRCETDRVGADLLTLVPDLHASVAAGVGDAELLRLLALLHVQGTQAWLRDVAAPLDLVWQAATLAQQAADRLADPLTSGVVAFGTVHGLLAAGAFELAREHLARATAQVGTSTPEAMQLDGMLAVTGSLLAAAENRAPDVIASLDHATELAARTGEGNAFWFGFGPANVGVWRMAVALEAGDHEQAAAVAESLNPETISHPQRRAAYWADYGRALTRLRGRLDDAALALRRAEMISPARVQRHPVTRETLAELVTRARRDAVGRELRDMAYRAGLSV